MTLKKHTQNLALIAVSSCSGLLLVEIFLKFIFAVNSSANDSEYFLSASFDKFNTTQVLSVLRSSNLDAYPLMPPTDFAMNKVKGASSIWLSGLPNTLTLYCRELNGWKLYRSDSLGFYNNKVSYENATRFILGDSFANGSCVPYKSTFAGLLKEMSGADYYNLAIAGNGPELEYATFREYISNKKQLDEVLLFYFEGNDLDNLANHRNHPIIRSYINDEGYSQGHIIFDSKRLQRYYIDYLESNSILREMEYVWRLPRIRSLLSKLKLRREDFSLPDGSVGSRINNHSITIKEVEYQSEVFNEFKSLVLRINRETQKRGGRFVFFYLPQIERYDEDLRAIRFDLQDGSRRYFPSNRKQVIDFLKSENIKYFDATSVIDASANASLFYGGGHYSEYGYRTITEAYETTKYRSSEPTSTTPNSTEIR